MTFAQLLLCIKKNSEKTKKKVKLIDQMKDDEFISADGFEKEEGQQQKTKKRKRSSGEEQNDGKLSVARSLCTSASEFAVVSKFTPKKLDTWIQEQEFKKDQALKDSFFSGVHRMYAFLLDTLTRGEGHVRQAVENDHSLRDAIAQEGAGLLQFINNKARIGLLSGGAVISGKMIQKRENSRTGFAVVEEEQTKEKDGGLPGTTELPGEVQELDVPTTNGGGEGGGEEQPDCEEGMEWFD